MTEKSSNLTRRKFMLMSSAAAISSPLLWSTGSMAAGKTAEAKATVTNVPKGVKVYFIGHGCIGCQACRTFCPAKAIHFGDTGNEIDQNKCMHCGTCYRECPISVVSETILA
jgi:ferredoxin